MKSAVFTSAILSSVFALTACGGGGSSGDATATKDTSAPATAPTGDTASPPVTLYTASLTGSKIGSKQISTKDSSTVIMGSATSTTIQTNEQGLTVTLLKNTVPTVTGLNLETLSVTVVSVVPSYGAIPTDAITNGGNCYLPTSQQLPATFRTCESMGITYNPNGEIVFSKTSFSGITGDIGSFLADGKLTFKKP